jgi:hypothetical protein
MKGRLTGMKAMTVFIVFLLALPLTSRTNRFATLTVAVPSAGISLPLQLVIAYGWQIEVKKPSATLGGPSVVSGSPS